MSKTGKGKPTAAPRAFDKKWRPARPPGSKPILERKKRTPEENAAIRHKQFSRREALRKMYEDRAAGRPPVYDPVLDGMVRDMRMAACTDEQICAGLGLTTVSTLNEWKAKHPTFLQAFLETGEVMRGKLARKMWHKAMGYSHKAEKIHVSGTGAVTRVKYREHYPPDTSAGIFLMTNLDPARWKHRQSQELSGPDGAPLPPAQFNVLPVAPRPREEFDKDDEEEG